MATMKQVAKSAMVSVATVSRVINDTGYVSPELSSRVRSAMVSLNYQPSALARGLRKQQTQNIGILIPQVDHPFFSRLAFAIEKTLFSHSYHCFLCSAEEDSSKENAYIEMLLRQRVDGVILAPTGQSEEGLEHLLRKKVPLVLVDRNLSIGNVNRVLSNNYQGAVEVTRYLLALGHRKFCVIGTPAYSEAMTQRLSGVRDALHNFGIDNPIKPIITSGLQQFEMGLVNARKMLQASPRPTAIIALTDVIAFGVLHAAAELGLSVPEELSVTGFDDIPLASYSIPSLTTVAQPIYRMGETAAQALLEQIQDSQASPATTVLDTTLITRKSTAPLTI